MMSLLQEFLANLLRHMIRIIYIFLTFPHNKARSTTTQEGINATLFYVSEVIAGEIYTSANYYI